MPATPEPPFENQPHAISLDELAAAFAEAMGAPPEAATAANEPDRPAAADAGEPESAPQPDEPTAAAVDADECCPISPRSILEAMLFVGNSDDSPLPPVRAAELMRGVEPGEIAALVDELNARYAGSNCPYRIVSEGSGYRLAILPEYHPVRERFYGRVREARLSQAAVDVLALVAYQQPLTAEQVSRFRGKPSGHILSHLVHRGLLRIERGQSGRRTADYYTTDRFLELFGLGSLDDLPRDER